MSSKEIAATNAARKYFSAVASHQKEANASHTLFNAFNVDTTLGTGTFGRVRKVSMKAGLEKVGKEGAQASAPETLPKYFALKIMKKSEVIRLKQVRPSRRVVAGAVGGGRMGRSGWGGWGGSMLMV